VLAQDCDQADYTKLIQALCNEVNVHLIRVPQAVQLGEWAGLCKLDAEGTARKVGTVLIHRSTHQVKPFYLSNRSTHQVKPFCLSNRSTFQTQLVRRYVEVVKCSCVVVSDYGEETEGLTILQEFLKSSTA
jgi:small subunit ribosomal protein S12e